MSASASIGEQIAALGEWFHNLHLPDGTQTSPNHPFGDFPSFKWQQVTAAVPQDLRGWSVLDIGCNAGFYSIEMARRGANVLGLMWNRCICARRAGRLSSSDWKNSWSSPKVMFIAC